MKKNIITEIRRKNIPSLVISNHAAIVQSILDFDYCVGKQKPSILGIITKNRTSQKFFYGSQEVLIPCYRDLDHVPLEIGKQVLWMLNVSSGRRVCESVLSFFKTFPHALGGHIFAENVPEIHAQEIIHTLHEKYTIIGPSGVGCFVPGYSKLGAIGGIEITQLEAAKICTPGNIAIISTSGGMANELIRAVVEKNRRVSFALALGGDHFPITSIRDAFLLAEDDPNTDAIVYFGELGGVDEYEIIGLIKERKCTKPIIAYIAGIIDESFTERVQFGHAKALVQNKDDSASAKRIALKKAGVSVPHSFTLFLEKLDALPQGQYVDPHIPLEQMKSRHASILSTRRLRKDEHIPTYVHNKKIKDTENVFVTTTLEALLQKKVRSPITKKFTEIVFSTMFDNGGHVSGAVNTMITARAGKDMVSSLVSGLLTIGPRFGGAINQAAQLWFNGVQDSISAKILVETYAKKGELILGIGHKKYRVGIPDPRVEVLASFAKLLKKHLYYDFAREVEKLTTSKNGSLILNVDGTIAALLLDILCECEKYTKEELQVLIDAEFFNAFFIIPRTVGFIGHFMEQKRNDEGLFRLPENLLFQQE